MPVLNPRNIGFSFAATWSEPAAETGGRPAISAARHTKANARVNPETVLSRTPRAGFSMILSGAGGAVARDRRMLLLFTCFFMRGILLLLCPMSLESAAIATILSAARAE